MYMNNDTACRAYLFDENGFIIKDSKLRNVLNYDYYKLLCVIKDQIDSQDILYPKLYAYTQKKLLAKIDVALLAEKNKLKLIHTGVFIPDGLETVIVFKKNKIKALMYYYMYKFYNPRKKGLNNAVYINEKIQGYDNKYIRNLT